MRKFGPDTRGLGGRMIVNRIIEDHSKKMRQIKTSCSVYVDSGNVCRRKKKVLIKRKLSTDCYEPETYPLRDSLSQNKKKRSSLQLHLQDLEHLTLKRKISSMRHSWFSISSFIFNPCATSPH